MDSFVTFVKSFAILPAQIIVVVDGRIIVLLQEDSLNCIWMFVVNFLIFFIVKSIQICSIMDKLCYE